MTAGPQAEHCRYLECDWGSQHSGSLAAVQCASWGNEGFYTRKVRVAQQQDGMVMLKRGACRASALPFATCQGIQALPACNSN